jgi:hypothetical protein
MLAQPGNSYSLGLDAAVLVAATAPLVVIAGRLYSAAWYVMFRSDC